MIVVGIDPGMSGGLSYISDKNLITYSFKDQTFSEIAEEISILSLNKNAVRVYLEKVHSMPMQGVASSFKFGMNYGFIQGCLTSLGLSYELVTPQLWQKTLNIPKRQKPNEKQTQFKKRLRGIAQALYPGASINSQTADAVLIMQYGIKVYRD